MDKLAPERTPGQIINATAKGKYVSLLKVTPAGSLEVRKLASGTFLYWRVTLDGKASRVTIGTYDSNAPPKSLDPTLKGYSVQAAVLAAQALARAHVKHLEIGGYAGMLHAESEAARIAAVAVADVLSAAQAVKTHAAQYQLQNLMTDYVDHLKALGRQSHADVRSTVNHHVIAAWPDVAALPANEVTPEQVADMMRKCLESGKGRTANKLRSYLRAGYQVAMAARSSPSIPLKFKKYNVTTNPAASTAPDATQNKADKNPLSAAELRTYWQSIKFMPGFVGAVLRLHLLTGGQRIAQLVRLRTQDIAGDVIVLHDGKGKPGQPARPHQVPLVPAAAAALRECNPTGTYALSTDEEETTTKKGTERKIQKGDTHLAATTLSRWAVAAAPGIKDFEAKRIRSGVETLLASVKISKDDRGRLQSHGISGVQAKHYDAHDYLDEKRNALEVLFNLLDTPAADNVLRLKVA
jgi:integrase